MRARLGLELKGHLDPQEALNDARYADRLAKFKNPKVKRILALAHLQANDNDHAIRNASLALELGGMPTVNHLIMSIAEAKRDDSVAAREHLNEARAQWPQDLTSPSDFRATASTGFQFDSNFNSRVPS